MLGTRMLDDAATVQRAQAGAIHHRQATALGMSERRIASRLRSGTWIRAHDRVYVAAGAPDTFLLSCWAAYVAVRFSAQDRGERPVAVAGLAAAYQHGFDVPEPRRVDLVIPIADWAPRLRGVRIVRASTWTRRSFTTRGGLLLTGVADTVVDVARHLSRERVHAIVQEAAFARPGLPYAILAACRRGRAGSAAARRAAALVLAGVDSALHERGRAILVAAGLPHPECGAVLARRAGPSDCVIRRPDAVGPPFGLVVEWDGDAHRVDRRTFLHDREKDRLVRRAGFVTVRYTAEQVRQAETLVADVRAEWEAILRSLQAVRPVPA